MNVIRNALIVMAVICGPVFLGSMLWGLVLIKEQVSLLAYLLIVASYITVALGAASLLDKRQMQYRHQTDEPRN